MEAVGLLCSPNAQRKLGAYPVAKINITGSGSNKFCLAVLLGKEGVLANSRVGG